MYNFIVFSLARWNVDYGCNVKDICAMLAELNHKVLYIDVPLKRRDRWFKKEKDEVKEVESRLNKKEQLIQIAPNLWHYIDDSVLESVNSLGNVTLFDWLVKINNVRFSKSIKRAAKAVGFESYILVNDNNVYDGYYLGQLLKPQLYVYYLRDHLPAMAYWKKHVSRLQPALIESMDLVVTNSLFLENYARATNANSKYVGQGCDINHFLKEPQVQGDADLLGGIKRPIVGYIGALNSERLNIDLICKVSEQLPEYSFVLIGKEDEGFKASKLHQLGNVYFLGNKDFDELPKLMYQFNVAINPQNLNEITVGNYPRKIDEYLAAGRPVVATRTPTMEAFADYVYLSENSEIFIQHIKKAIEEDTRELQQKRKDFASQHNWLNGVNAILSEIEQTLEK